MTLGVIQAPPTAGLPALAAAAEFIAKDCKIAFDANQISSRYSHTKTQVDSPASITDGWMFWVCSSVEARRDSQSVWSWVSRSVEIQQCGLLGVLISIGHGDVAAVRARGAEGSLQGEELRIR